MKIMNVVLCNFILSFFLLVISAGNLNAQQFGIAATVNDEAISTIAVKERLELAIISSGLPDSAEVRAKLLPQVVQLLIDETLLEQDAVSRSINISESEIANAMASIATKNNIPASILPAFFQEKGISERAVRAQVNAQIVKAKLMARAVKPQVSVTEQEIEEKMENIASQSGKEEFNISEIVLPVDTPEDETKISKLADKLYEELNAGGDFESVAREFSRSSTSSSGGKLGWIVEDSLSSQLQIQIGNLKSGEVSRPLRLADGYHIMRLNERRAVITAANGESEIGLRQLFIPISSTDNEENEAKLMHLTDAQKTIRGCNNFVSTAEKLGSTADPKMVMTQLKDVKEEIRNVLAQLPVGMPSPLMKSEQGVHVFMVCERIEATENFVQPERVREVLEQQELELYFRRYVQELRRDGFIEIRL